MNREQRMIKSEEFIQSAEFKRKWLIRPRPSRDHLNRKCKYSNRFPPGYPTLEEFNEMRRLAAEESRKLHDKRQAAIAKRVIETCLEHGYAFQPSDEQLLKDFLLKKNEGKPMPYSMIEDDADVHKKHPEQVIGEARFGYVFTESEDTEGKWIPGEEVVIKNQDEELGTKQLLCFWEGGVETCYRMIKYRVQDGHSSLCKLYKDFA